MSSSWNDKRIMAYSKRRLSQIYAATGHLNIACDLAEEAKGILERVGISEELAKIESLVNLLQTNTSNDDLLRQLLEGEA